MLPFQQPSAQTPPHPTVVKSRLAAALLLLGCLGFGTPASAQTQTGAAPPPSEAYSDVLRKPGDDAALRAFLDRLPKIEVADDDGGTREYYLVEGDVVATAAEVEAHLKELRKRVEVNTPAPPSGELLVITDSHGQPLFWERGKRHLTYAVKKASFQDQIRYDDVVKRMKLAGEEWVRVCSGCDLRIEHKSEFDDQPSLSKVTFIVQYEKEQNSFIAAAFFPKQDRFRNFLVIGPQFFSTSFDRTGVLRHEIGHILGYRHMHIVGIPGCSTEDANWKAITDVYDKKSVMHYYCGGGGTRDLALSEQDKIDHNKLYGK
ncbi:hypothetical protein [Bosea psychrotolerans]|uniref:Dual-action HEIGH metallo-peptidase n=1 Tax=Bosea psychrotolerans TaxID=1871628 RepID=A0A2S4MDA7_9HYPH|nr:hypothetical protein [Bosea psychrotolerans]POR52605.1 hypothetical protein CYD53_105270 [Bosea psychrotolerans]